MSVFKDFNNKSVEIESIGFEVQCKHRLHGGNGMASSPRQCVQISQGNLLTDCAIWTLPVAPQGKIK